MSRRRVALTAGIVAAGAWKGLAARPPGGRSQWEKPNYRNRMPSLLGGPAVTMGAVVAAAPVTPLGALVGLGAGALGVYDDLAGETHARGLRGHLRALARGEVTTGMVKLAGLAAIGASAAACNGRRRGDLVVDTALVAGAANALNLLDLRPGRALKAACGVGVPLLGARDPAGSGTAAAVVGAAASMLPADLGESAMIGDCGANALGAMLGWSLAESLGARGRRVALAGVVAFTLASERMSFTDLIARTPWLASIDEWGRCPPDDVVRATT